MRYFLLSAFILFASNVSSYDCSSAQSECLNEESNDESIFMTSDKETAKALSENRGVEDERHTDDSDYEPGKPPGSGGGGQNPRPPLGPKDKPRGGG